MSASSDHTMTIIKTEGFNMPGSSTVRPSIHRPFSDGSMTVETSLLQSLMTPNSHPANLAMTSPFAFSLPLQTQPQPQEHPFDFPMNSPMSTGADGFHPAAMFNSFKFGNEHPEPPINLPAVTSTSQRSRSESASRESNVGKAAPSKPRQGRKLSMNDARPASGSIQARGRAGLPPRSQSMSLHSRTGSQGQGKLLGLGVGLDTHIEGEKTDSISPPDFGMNTAFGMSIPLSHSSETPSWASGSLPTMVPGSFGSFSGETTTDDAIIDSPMTPARPLTALSEESFKKQRRRQSHNAVEKRRREHINTKIDELSQLLPAMYSVPAEHEEAVDDEEDDEEVHASPIKKKKTKRAGSSAKAQKDAAHCKGRILSQSVFYIRDLKFLTDKQSERIAQLEAQMLSFGINPALQHLPLPPTSLAHQQQQHHQQPPIFWPTNYTGLPQDLAQGLEAMRPSPELESQRPFSLEHLTWANHPTTHSNDVLMTFEPSPSDGSASAPGSTNDIRRSSSASSDDGAQSMILPQDEMRGRQRERTVRNDSQAELQMSMNGLFGLGGHKEENTGGMRW